MRLLFDECVSRLFKSGFAAHGHECFTVPEVGLAGRKNGELLTLAEGRFDVFVTIEHPLSAKSFRPKNSYPYHPGQIVKSSKLGFE